MWKYKITVAYSGSRYCGWQKQKAKSGPDRESVQGMIEAALAQITREAPSVVGSGRTDSGVHAAGQVAHFVLRKTEREVALLHRALNGVLPSTIQVSELCAVPLEFHAQRSAQKKQYSYYFQQGACPMPHLEPYSWWIRKSLNLEEMRRGLGYLVGEHDYKAFQASGSKPGPTVRRILEADLTVLPIPFPGPVDLTPGLSLVRMRVVGTGFLKQMVRGIAGTLLQVGEERRPASCILEILETRNRDQVGPTAPARALWLERVWY